MIRKWEILNIIYGDMNNPVTAEDLLENPLLIRLNISKCALGMLLLRSFRQGLLKRFGKGGWSDPYRYQLTKKGTERRIHLIKEKRKRQKKIKYFREIPIQIQMPAVAQW